MFDRQNRGTITFEDFGALWNYITEWQNCFRSFDKDNSGNIDANELKAALTTFGYRLNDATYQTLLRKFDRLGKGTIYFDDFIQCSIILHVKPSTINHQPILKKIYFYEFIFLFHFFKLQNLTSGFRQYDTSQTGVITIGYEQFLNLVLNSRAWINLTENVRIDDNFLVNPWILVTLNTFRWINLQYLLRGFFSRVSARKQLFYFKKWKSIFEIVVSPQSFGVYPKYSLENIKCKIQLLKCQKGTIDKGHKILQLVFTFTLGTRTAILILEEKLDSYFLCCWSNCHSINYYSPTFYFTYINMWNERWENHLSD